jgi:hypothetical protein
MLLWLYQFDMARYYKAIFTLTKQDLVRALTLKLEMTTAHYSDIFAITVQAFGGKIKKDKVQKRTDAPPADFDTLANFIGAM